MKEPLIAFLQAIQSYLPIVLGVATGIIVKKCSPPQRLFIIIRKIEILAMYILLPYIFAVIVITTKYTTQLLFSIGTGFLLPLLSIAASSILKPIIYKVPQVNKHDIELRLLTATYGGGNRGLAAIGIITAINNGVSSILPVYLMVDLGNFIFLLVIMPIIIRILYNKTMVRNENIRNTHIRKYNILYMIIHSNGIALLLWFIIVLIINHLYPGIMSRRLRPLMIYAKFMLFYLLFMVLVIKMKGQVRNINGKLLIYFITVRTIVIILLAVVMLIMRLYYHSDLITHVFMALIVLALMPPSSLMPAIMRNSGAPDDRLDIIYEYYAITNIYYIIVMMVITIASLLAALNIP